MAATRLRWFVCRLCGVRQLRNCNASYCQRVLGGHLCRGELDLLEAGEVWPTFAGGEGI